MGTLSNAYSTACTTDSSCLPYEFGCREVDDRFCREVQGVSIFIDFSGYRQLASYAVPPSGHSSVACCLHLTVECVVLCAAAHSSSSSSLRCRVKVMTHWKVFFRKSLSKENFVCVSWKLSQVFYFRKQLSVISESSILESFLSQSERCDWSAECML